MRPHLGPTFEEPNTMSHSITEDHAPKMLKNNQCTDNTALSRLIALIKKEKEKKKIRTNHN